MKKQSERRIPIKGTQGVRIVDDGYTMGEIWVEDGHVFVLNTLTGRPSRAEFGTPSWDVKIRVTGEDKRRQVRMVSRAPESVTDYRETRNGVGYLKRLPTKEELETESANTVHYVAFPDFELRADKLVPRIQALQDAGITEIEYSHLRRLYNR